MNKAIFTFVLCAMLTAVVGAETRLGDCKRENVTDVGLLDGKTPVVAYYTEEQGLISVMKKYYVDVGDRTEGPYDREVSLKFSSDGKMMAYWASIDGKSYFVANGEKAGPYDNYKACAFSPDNNMPIYSAKIGDDLYDGWYVIQGKTKTGPYSSYVSDFFFAPDGKKFWYTVSTDYKYYVIGGNEKAGPYDYYISDLTFSLDGKTLVYSAKIDGHLYIILGKEKIGPLDYDHVSRIAFYSDGKRLAYVASNRDAIYKNKIHFYVVNDKTKSGPYDTVLNLTFSHNGKTLAYGAKIGNKYYVIVGKEEAGPYDGIGEMLFSNDGKRLAYPAKIDGKMYVVVGNEKAGPYDGIQHIRFSPDGKTLTYIASVGGRTYVMTGTEKTASYDGECYFTFSSDETAFVYSVEEGGKYCVVIGDKKSRPYGGIQNITFSPDRKSVAYFALTQDGKVKYDKDTKVYVVVDGNEVGPYLYPGLMNMPDRLEFSLDSTALAYHVQVEGEPYSAKMKWQDYLLIDVTPYIGSICGGHAVYLKDGAIWTR